MYTWEICHYMALKHLNHKFNESMHTHYNISLIISVLGVNISNNINIATQLIIKNVSTLHMTKMFSMSKLFIT